MSDQFLPRLVRRGVHFEFNSVRFHATKNDGLVAEKQGNDENSGENVAGKPAALSCKESLNRWQWNQQRKGQHIICRLSTATVPGT